MDLIKRYVAAVGRRIWRKDRKDIQAELETVLLDMLDERGGPEGATEEEVIKLLREYGQPGEVAARYSSDEQHLIGPKVFSLYQLVLKIVLLSVGLGITVAHVVSLFSSQPPWLLLWLLQLGGSLLGAGLTAFGSVTLVFALIERYADEGELEAETRDWDPRDLPVLSESNQLISPLGEVIQILFLGLVLLLVNVFPQYLGIMYWDSEGVRHSWGLFMNTVLYENLFLFNAILAASLLMRGFLLKTGRKTIGLRIFSVIIAGASLVLMYRLWVGRPFFGPGGNLPGEWTVILGILESMVPFVLGIISLGLLADVVREVWGLWKESKGASESSLF